MDAWLEFGLETIRWLQENYPQLEGFFLFLTSFGNEQAYLVVLPLIYWSINKRLGQQIGYLFFIAVTFNTIAKQTFRGPRPFWIEPELGLDNTAGYGMPSGHTQYATVIYLLIASWVKRGWAWLLAIFMVILMALSRVYLGEHFVHDVILGFVLGLFVLIGFFFWQRPSQNKFSKRILGQKLLAMILIPLISIVIFVGVRMIIGDPDMSVAWADLIPQAEFDTITEMATAVGATLGFGIGIVLEHSRVRFRVDGSLAKRFGRYLIGIVVMVIIWRGLGIIFPRDPLWLALPLRVFRYMLLTLWGAYYAPMVFVRINLADADPDPGMSLKL